MQSYEHNAKLCFFIANNRRIDNDNYRSTKRQLAQKEVVSDY